MGRSLASVGMPAKALSRETGFLSHRFGKVVQSRFRPVAQLRSGQLEICLWMNQLGAVKLRSCGAPTSLARFVTALWGKLGAKERGETRSSGSRACGNKAAHPQEEPPHRIRTVIGMMVAVVRWLRQRHGRLQSRLSLGSSGSRLCCVW